MARSTRVSSGLVGRELRLADTMLGGLGELAGTETGLTVPNVPGGRVQAPFTGAA